MGTLNRSSAQLVPAGMSAAVGVTPLAPELLTWEVPSQSGGRAKHLPEEGATQRRFKRPIGRASDLQPRPRRSPLSTQANLPNEQDIRSHEIHSRPRGRRARSRQLLPFSASSALSCYGHSLTAWSIHSRLHCSSVYSPLCKQSFKETSWWAAMPPPPMQLPMLPSVQTKRLLALCPLIARDGEEHETRGSLAG
ncbi:hypothetical protein EYF80_033395 [Liparis tanakae]|uniref:Uncharacterized protein n=1 Tax=Liparis tanakae TaxID=230148 RepID=A0A4Z2GSJ5_9TELE|nr:hypothetical protein EYF80_033395 [Liparis tanakae]